MPTGTLGKTKIVNGVKYQQCTKCEEWLPATKEYFYWVNNHKYLRAACKQCECSRQKEYYENNKDKVKEYVKQYQEDNKEKIRDYRKEYCENTKDRMREYQKEYYKNTKEERKGGKKEWYENNKEKMKEYQKEWHENNKDKIKEYRENNKEGINEKRREWQKNNKEKIKEYYENNKEKIKEYRKEYTGSPALFVTYASQLTVEEDSIEGEDGKLLCKCAYCGQYFYPTTLSVVNRIGCLSGRMIGEMRLYCSKGCKSACPIFKQKTWPKGYKPASSREVDPLIRQMCLKRDNYTCQKCEKTIDQIELHAHHIEGAVQQPMLANDVDNTITLCKPCHKWVHKQKGCTNYDLRCKK